MTIGTTHGLSIGDHTAGGVRNITFEDITCTGSDKGINFRNERGMNGLVEDITYKNIRFYNVSEPIRFSFNYIENLPPANQTATPMVRNVKIDNIFSDGAEFGWILDGLPESIIYNVAFSNIHFINTKKLFETCNYFIGSCYNVTPACPPCLT